MILLDEYLTIHKNAFIKSLNNNKVALDLLSSLNDIVKKIHNHDVDLIKKFSELRKYLVTSDYEKKHFINLCDAVFNIPKKKVQRYFSIVDNILPITFFEWENYNYSQLVEILPLANITFKKHLKNINTEMSCKEIRKYVKSILNESDKKDAEEILKQETAPDIDVSKFALRNAFAKAIEKFQYDRQDVNVVVNYIAEQLNIDIDKLFNNVGV